MIKLKNLLAETRTSMKLESDNINFTITSKGASVILIPDSKGLDTIDKIKSNIGSSNKDKIFDQFVINRLQRTTGIKFERDTRYPGAGYAYVVDMDDLIKKIS